MLVITVPGVLFDPLREGAYAASRDVAEAIDHGEDLAVCRARLAGVCRLLDVIGWTREHPAADTEVDFGVHAGTLRVAVEIMLPLLRDAGGERERFEALRQFAATELSGSRQRLTLPAEVVVLLRGVLHAGLARAAEDLAEACSLASPGDRLGPIGRLDGVRALLDEIGWRAPERQQPVEIDLGMHGPLLQDIMETDLDTQRWLADTDDAIQRERAAATAVRVEWVLTHLQGAS
jgi:hypothetical protein